MLVRIPNWLLVLEFTKTSTMSSSRAPRMRPSPPCLDRKEENLNPYLLTTIEMGPAVVRRIINQIPQSRLDEAIDPERFTPREVVAHLADWEAIDRLRLSAGVERPGSAIQPYDEVQMALDHQYRQSDVNAQ